jgi:uncharacterized protein
MQQAIIIAACAYLAISALVYLAQRRLQYHPSREAFSPAELGLSNVEIVKLQTSDGETIIGWYAEAQAGKPTILFFHGNGGDISGRTERFRFYQVEGYGVFFLSYRGYGASSGSPTEPGLVADATAAHNWLTTHGVSPERIALVGESLGTGVAVQLAAKMTVGAMALEAPFTSAADVARLSYWWLPVGLLMKDQFNSAPHIGDIHVPILVIHGTADEIIPLRLGEALFARANAPKEFVAVAGGTHESIFAPESWRREVNFFDNHIGK